MRSWGEKVKNQNYATLSWVAGTVSSAACSHLLLGGRYGSRAIGIAEFSKVFCLSFLIWYFYIFLNTTAWLLVEKHSHFCPWYCHLSYLIFINLTLVTYTSYVHIKVVQVAFDQGNSVQQKDITMINIYRSLSMSQTFFKILMHYHLCPQKSYMAFIDTKIKLMFIRTLISVFFIVGHTKSKYFL